MYPDWLPAQVTLSGSSINDDYDTLYEIFKRDVLESELVIDGYPVTVDTGKDDYLPQFERGFTHIVTCNDGAGGRTIDYDRAKKITWVKAVITNYQAPEVYSFWCKAPRGEVLYLWLADHDFVVILKWMGAANEQTKIIVTAFHVDSSRKRHFQRLYGSATRVL